MFYFGYMVGTVVGLVYMIALLMIAKFTNETTFTVIIYIGFFIMIAIGISLDIFVNRIMKDKP